ncbi:MAG: type II secretion system F family protein [Dehalococcoidia bacterium]|nr:type II secretion system F family protein [Dehalococcoidia bacterium]
MVLPIISSVFVFLAVGSVAVWRFQQANAQLDARLRTLADQQAQSLALREIPFEHRVVLPVVDGIASAIISTLPPAFIARTRRTLVAAGEPMALVTFFVFVMFMLVLLPGTYLLVAWAANGGSISAKIVLGVPLFALLGVIVPFLWLRRRARRRRLIIWRGLPDAFDLMTTCVEAGLGLDSAFQKVSDKLGGPVSDEFAEMLREVAMGKTRRDALRDMGERTGVPDLQSFANTIVQAEELGTSLGAALRAQASDMRRRRRQHAEEEARRAPSKMVFPLVFFILPSLFVVILGPVAIEMVKIFSD